MVSSHGTVTESTEEGRSLTNTWVSLHHHSTFSHGDGFGTPEQHAARGLELGYDTLALTEHGGVSSHFRFEKTAIKQGIKPVFGLEAYGGFEGIQPKNHLILLAKNAEGYRSLNKLVTQSWLDFYYYPTVLGANLAANHNGLICLSGCLSSLLACTMIGGKGIETGDYDKAAELAGKFKRLFGEDYYLEVQQFPELEKTCELNPLYERLGRELGIPLVATADVHYPYPDDNEMQVILHAADRGGKTVDQQAATWEYDIRLTLPESDDILLRRMVETGLTYHAAVDSIETSRAIADSCNVTLPKAERLVYPIEESDWDESGY